MALSKGERARFGDGRTDSEGVLYDYPLTLTIAAMDKETADTAAAMIVEKVFNEDIKEGKRQGVFDHVMWEPIEVRMGEEKQGEEEQGEDRG